MTDKELATFEAGRDIGAEMVQFVRTLQGWEQGRCEPTGAAKTLLAIAQIMPEALLAVA